MTFITSVAIFLYIIGNSASSAHAIFYFIVILSPNQIISKRTKLHHLKEYAYRTCFFCLPISIPIPIRAKSKLSDMQSGTLVVTTSTLKLK